MTKHIQFRISTLLVIVAFVAMASIIVVTRIELARLKASLAQPAANALPIPADIVAASVERNLESHPLPTSVTDVRYSSTDDSFKVRYQWTDPTANRKWSSDVTLKGNGFGEYTGTITNKKFLYTIPLQLPGNSSPLGNVGRMMVGVSTPSSIEIGK